MDIKWYNTFEKWPEMDSFKDKVKTSINIIKKVLNEYNKPYIAFSGGKDSTAMLHLVTEQKKDIMTLHWDFGKYYIPREIHKEIIKNAKLINKNLRIETSPKYNELGKNAINILGSEMLCKLVPSLAKEGYDCSFIGLRIEESYKRKRRIKAGKSLTKIKECWPLKDWSWLDVWGYIVSNNIPYLLYYDKYAPVVGWDKTRFTTLFDPEFDKLGCSNVDGVLSWKYRNTLK